MHTPWECASWPTLRMCLLLLLCLNFSALPLDDVQRTRQSRVGYLYWRKKDRRWEPRYSPSRTRRLSLGQYIEEDDAKVVLHAAQYYFNEEEPTVNLWNGFLYTIEHVSDQEREDISEEKRRWVPAKAKEVLEDYKREKKDWEDRILSDEFLRDIEVNQLPNLENEEVQAAH